MPLLLDNDHRELEECGVSFVEDEARRFLILKDFELPPSIYLHERCNVLVVIPPNYNQGGIDMFWTFPKLERTDGLPIPATCGPDADSRAFEGSIFCRWSRHWQGGSEMRRPGIDDVTTILHRITWALNHPDTQ